MGIGWILAYGALIFAPYFLRGDLIGNDSYYYLTEICQGNYFAYEAIPSLFDHILPYIPCDIFLIKIILLSLFLLSLFVINEIGKLFNKENIGFLALMSPILLLEATKFESEAFAMPLLLLGTYFYFRALGTENFMFKIVQYTAFIVLMEKAVLFWKGSLVYAGILTFPYSIPFIGAYILYSPASISTILPDLSVLEELPLMVIGILFMITGLLAVEKRAKWQTWGFFALGALQLKFLVYSIPFLALGIDNRIKELYAGKIPYWAYFIPILWIIPLMMAPPTVSDWEVVDQVVNLHNLSDNPPPIYNEWGRGYWYHYKGLDVNYYGWSDPERLKCGCPGICIDKKEVTQC